MVSFVRVFVGFVGSEVCSFSPWRVGSLVVRSEVRSLSAFPWSPFFIAAFDCRRRRRRRRRAAVVRSFVVRC